MNAWTFEGQPRTLGDTVTLVEGGSFCVCGPDGDIRPGGAQGVYHADTRLLSRWELRVDDTPVETLRVIPAEPYHATFLGRTRPRPGRAESTLLAVRERYVGGGLREDLTLRNLSEEPAGCVVALHAGSDVADLFEVKAGRVRRVGEVEVTPHPSGLRLFAADRSRGARITVEPHDEALTVTPGLLAFRVVVPARGEWRTTIQVNPIIEGEEASAAFLSHHAPEHAAPARRLADWTRLSPDIRTGDAALEEILRRSRQDLGSLRLFDPDHPEDPPAIAAGAPWFMTLFGRDSLLTSWMALPLDQSLALGTLRRLARLQGRRADPLTEEEPGKIMHELRSGVGGHAYYGSVDATPLFVMLLGELRRWGLHPEAVEELLPHADAALGWIEACGGPDGLLWYRRKTDQGLLNQGWKDSVDGVNFADGALARPPVALAEVQGYVHAAYLARAHIACEAGDAATERRCLERAAAIREAFNERFWLADRGYYAMGLDGSGRPVDALASNMGHCLWTGIVEEDRAASVAAHLMSPRMFTGYGVRTLAADMGAYNPMSYHNGSVWPHDNALVAAGLMRYGFVAEAQRIATGLLEAARAFGGRLPELFCGFDRAEFPCPVPYPTSCSPQAWAAAAPIQLLRSLLRLDPWVPYGKAWLAPALPEGFGGLRISGLPLAGSRITVEVPAGGRTATVSGLPAGIELITEPRGPVTAAGRGSSGPHRDRRPLAG
ncbi:glycogen debranching N-terminal domain-containing protein [Planomonospora corallina]|uniref:Glycogen debranching N-terminal domain-containing protein n=1 Tax=Planomonospora corallina TaxID=1806052 RepID=A0ABV8ICN0_9ACTN